MHLSTNADLSKLRGNRGPTARSGDSDAANIPHRWLTVNPDYAQSWAVGTGRLPYSRTEMRLTVEIPDDAKDRLSHWIELGPLISGAYETLSAFGDPENWRLFRGDIPASWITDYGTNKHQQENEQR